jgi:hypothetical protein
MIHSCCKAAISLMTDCKYQPQALAVNSGPGPSDYSRGGINVNHFGCVVEGLE